MLHAEANTARQQNNPNNSGTSQKHLVHNSAKSISNEIMTQSNWGGCCCLQCIPEKEVGIVEDLGACAPSGVCVARRWRSAAANSKLDGGGGGGGGICC